jgi:hypothetical protein
MRWPGSELWSRGAAIKAGDPIEAIPDEPSTYGYNKDVERLRLVEYPMINGEKH